MVEHAIPILHYLLSFYVEYGETSNIFCFSIHPQLVELQITQYLHLFTFENCRAYNACIHSYVYIHKMKIIYQYLDLIMYYYS
jgi:hypothetical protein